MKSFYAILLLVTCMVALPIRQAHATSTALTIAKVVEAGVALNTVSADTTNGNSFDNTNGDVFVICDNTHATNSETFNFAVQNATKTVPGFGSLTKTNPLAIVVPALSKTLVGPFPKSAYNDGSGLVQVTYTGTGTPKIQAFKVDQLTYSGG